jgi:hypothetical protein
MNKDFAKLCTPAKIYFAIAVIAALIALFSGLGIVAVFMKLVFAFIWTFILSWLCKKGFESLSWFLVLLPYIVILIGILGLWQMTKEQKTMLNNFKLQGAWGKENFSTPAPYPIGKPQKK